MISLSLHSGPRPAHLEPFHQVTVKTRVDPSQSTRWSFPTCVCTRLQQNTTKDRNEYTHNLHRSENQTTVVQKTATVHFRTSHFTSLLCDGSQNKQAYVKKHSGMHFWFSLLAKPSLILCKTRNYEGILDNTLKVTASDLTSLTAVH